MTKEQQKKVKKAQKEGVWEKDDNGNWYLRYPGLVIPTVEPLW